MMTKPAPWLQGLLLVCLVAVAYLPATHGGFIWDDDVYVTGNELLAAPDGFRRIWFSLDSPSQYFPLTYTSFYLERGLWGLHAAGYHWVNLLLHSINAWLVWRLLLRLGVPGAWLGAALFALHPVQVESVAWITERKNVLMGLFFLLALRAWVEFVEPVKPRRWWFYAAALICYTLALSAKTTACTLPAALLLILWLKRIRLDGKRAAQVAPFVALGAGMGLVAIWWERFHQGTRGAVFSIGLVERFLIACRGVCFYLGKLVWPSDLTFSYPSWIISASAPAAWLWVLGLIGLVLIIWRARRYAGRSIETAGLFYVATLSPMLGFIMLYTFRYTFVADHYQYLACLGPAALAGAGMQRAAVAFVKQRHWIYAGSALLLTILGLLTWRQTRVYASDELLWRDTLAKNPGSWLACNNLGLHYLNDGKTDEAMRYFEQSIALNSRDPEAIYNLGNARLQKGELEEAVALYRRALELNPEMAEAHSNLGNVLFQLGHPAQAVQHWQKATALQPLNAAALNNLAWILATFPDDALRNGAQAVALAQRANHLTGGDNPRVLRTLAAAYAEAGRMPEAVATAQTAWQRAEAEGDVALANDLASQIKLHQSGLPMHGPSQIKP